MSKLLVLLCALAGLGSSSSYEICKCSQTEDGASGDKSNVFTCKRTEAVFGVASQTNPMSKIFNEMQTTNNTASKVFEELVSTALSVMFNSEQQVSTLSAVFTEALSKFNNQFSTNFSLLEAPFQTEFTDFSNVANTFLYETILSFLFDTNASEVPVPNQIFKFVTDLFVDFKYIDNLSEQAAKNLDDELCEILIKVGGQI